MERKKKNRSFLETKTRLIGIGGIGHGVGGTHFAILMLNYLAGYERHRSALLEWNGSGTLEKLEHVCTGKVSQKKPYRILDADYYKSVGSKELTEIYRRARYARSAVGHEDVVRMKNLVRKV